ncbi:MAG TPA: hypothetical protein VEV87_04970, partial [Chitinophagaceae bacterium]|nr:hypothetical protein [Chitinophagaceae bacterium]
MKPLKTVLLSFFVVSQLAAQINIGRDSISIVPETIAIAIDTIALAKSCAYQKDFENADLLLTKYNVDHVDIHALRLHAQVLYWMKAFGRSIEVYEKAIHIFPEPSALHVDYARVLFSLNKLPKAHRLLNAYRNHDSINVEAIIMTAYIELWNGKIGAAGKKAELVLKTYADNAEAKDIKSNISNWTVPYIKTGVEILSDDQPLKGNNFYAEAGVYRSWVFAPTIQAAIYRYSAEETRFRSSWMQLANSIQLGTRNKIKLKGGLFQQNSNSTKFTGGAEVSHQITRNFLFQATLEKRPYQYTISSIKSAVMESVTGISLSYNRN